MRLASVAFALALAVLAVWAGASLGARLGGEAAGSWPDPGAPAAEGGGPASEGDVARPEPSEDAPPSGAAVPGAARAPSEGAPSEADLPFSGVPAADAELDDWLIHHPPEDPRIVVTIADTPRAEAVVHLYDGDRLVGTFFGFGGPPDDPTIVGDYEVVQRLGRIHTGLYQAELGHEFWLRDFIQIQGNYGFHAYKINDATGEEEPGPTHGCIALPAGDEAALYEWVKIGTPVAISYVDVEALGALTR
ncbi:MAG: L,D-transpeptidase family protein [Clostridia bacterium]|nr:L,D-transpeptidase family protein [Clostridia bacterium]